MTLLNGLLAFGALAFTVPLVIHLLFRSRFRTIDWGAMHLLDNVVRVNRRRIQLMNLLLLLLRCLLPVLLAFCLARPVLTGFRSLPGDAPQSLVLVIDDSRSMAVVNEAGISRLERAQQALAGWLGELSRRDEVLLVRGSTVDDPAATMGPADAVRRVQAIAAESGPVDLSRLVRSGLEAAANASHAQRRVLVLSDFQSNLISDATLQSLDRLATADTDQDADQSDGPLISFLNYGDTDVVPANVSVESIEIESPAVVAGRQARFAARIRNSGDLPATDLRVGWSVSGETLPPETITIPPQSTVTVRLSRNLQQVGVQQLSVEVEHGDALAGDNRRSVAVDVIREINVLLVDGQPSEQPLQSETDFLAIALSPFAFGGEDQPDAVRTAVITARTLRSKLTETPPDIVVLANVPQLDGPTREDLGQFVNSGGALIVFDGDAIKIDSYNEPLGDAGDAWRLPAELGQTVGGPVSPTSEPLPLGLISSQYSPWQILESGQPRPLPDVDVLAYRQLTIPDAQADKKLRILWRMAGGDPLAVMARRGQGQVVQFAIPCDAAWTTLPMRMVYLPMMQQLVLDLAGSRKRTTADVGTGFTVPVSELTAAIPDNTKIDQSRSASYTLQPPGAAEIAIEPAGDADGQLLIPQTSTAGVYRLRLLSPVVDGGTVMTSTIRVAEVPAAESQLRPADPQRLAAAAESVSANVYSDLADLQDDERTRRFGREIWRWLLVALLVAMLAEMWLQQRSANRTVVVGTT